MTSYRPPATRPAGRPTSRGSAVTTPSARVATLNAWSDVDSWPRRLDVMGSQLAAAELDVICLQDAVVFDDGSSMALSLARRLGTGWNVLAADGWLPKSGSGPRAGLAILSRLRPATEPEWVPLPGEDMSGTSRRLLVARLTTSDDSPLMVGTTHLAWGAPLEALRARQVREINRFFATHSPLDDQGKPLIPTVLAGHFNSEPHCDALRFLRGEAVLDGASTFWVDAWTATQRDKPGFTVSPANDWAKDMAAGFGMGQLPSRRVDFILSRGFVFGRPGRPLRTDLLCDHPSPNGVFASDHFGLFADIALA